MQHGVPEILDMRLACWALNSQNILVYLLLACHNYIFPRRVLFYLIKGKKTDWFTNYTKVSTPTLPDEMYDEFHFRPKKKFNPWGSPGSAAIFGEGCGVNGGNPHGCQAGKLDTNPYGTCCSGGMYVLTGQYKFVSIVPCMVRSMIMI